MEKLGHCPLMPFFHSLTFILRTLASDASSKLDIFRHNGDSLGVDRAEIGILEEPHEVGFRGFLEGEHGRTLEAEIGLEVLRNLTHEALEGELSDEELRALLVLPDLTQGHSAGAEAMGLLDAACGGGGFAGGLGGQLLARSLSACRLASCLLGPGHGDGDGLDRKKLISTEGRRRFSVCEGQRRAAGSRRN